MSQLGAAPELPLLWKISLNVFNLRSLMIFISRGFFILGATREEMVASLKNWIEFLSTMKGLSSLSIQKQVSFLLHFRPLPIRGEARVARMREMELLNEYTLSLQAEEDLLRQNSRIQWLKAGDRNSSYFFKAINGRCNRSKIHSITSDDGSLIEGDIPVKNEAIRHFQNILGCSMPVRHGIGTLGNIIDNVISNDQADSMDRDVTNEEIREVWMASKHIFSRKLGILLVKT
ncbi:hypothetical protein Dsin_018634 [Dipteronia sinensis]|uniref:Uncharacterized protein n=1 Tax=Dipteronia sinensis TaxID=43782 RepID=A0AAE0A753_9ROSI|nr:hypothetical protein Dsin_018634 [Dipteronia sinensis]